ncbi:unnamed protein product [Malus baccata var. baccata]
MEGRVAVAANELDGRKLKGGLTWNGGSPMRDNQWAIDTTASLNIFVRDREKRRSVINSKDARQMCTDLLESYGTKNEMTSSVETQKTMKFLIGLNESYDTVQSNTLLLEPLPTVNKAYMLALQHECQAEVSNGKSTRPEAAGFAMKNSLREPALEDNEVRCGKCNKTNHITKNHREHLKCTFCGWKCHTFEFCQKRKATAEIESNRPFSSKRNQEDCKQILQMLNKNKSSFANQVGPSLEEDDWEGN